MSDKNSLIIASTNHHIRIIRSADIKDSIDSIDLIVPFNLKEEIQGQSFDNLSNIFYIRANKINDNFFIRKFFQFGSLLKVIYLLKKHRYKVIGICSPYNFVTNKLIKFIPLLNKNIFIHFFEDGLGFYSKSGENSPSNIKGTSFFNDYTDHIERAIHINKNQQVTIHAFFFNTYLSNMPIQYRLIDRVKFDQSLVDEYHRKKNKMLEHFKNSYSLNLKAKKNIFIFCPNSQIINYGGYKKVVEILGVKKSNSILFIKNNASDDNNSPIKHAIDLPSQFSLELFSYFFDEFFPNNNVYFISTISTFYYTNNSNENYIIDISYIEGNKELCYLSKYRFLDSAKINYLSKAEDLHSYYN